MNVSDNSYLSSTQKVSSREKRKVDSTEEKNETKIAEISLTEAMEQFEYASKVEGKAEKTLEQYDYVFDKLLRFLQEDPPLESIIPQQIRSFLKSLMEDDLSASTVSINYRVLQAFFNWLISEGLLESSPLKNIKAPKTPNKFPRVLNKEQTEKLIQAAKLKKHTWAGYRNYTMIFFFLDMGLRLNELINAKLSEIDCRERTLKVHGKGAKDRIVFFGLETYKALRKWLSIRNDKGAPLENTIFISQNGDRLKHRYVQQIITTMQERAGLENVKVSPHVLRHTAATLAVKNGMETFALKRFFGWEKIETAMRYVHMNNQAVKESFRKASPVDNLQRTKEI